MFYYFKVYCKCGSNPKGFSVRCYDPYSFRIKVECFLTLRMTKAYVSVYLQ